MFENLTDRLSGILDQLTKRGVLKESDVNEAMREVRRALLEADVGLDIVRSFTDKVRTRAVGSDVIKSVSPGQMVIKIVQEQLIELLGQELSPVDLNAPAPVPILMIGLQGSGKTTTTAKVGLRLTRNENRKVLMASLDTNRPAAQEQLKVLGEQNDINTLPIVAGQTPTQIAKRAVNVAKLGGYDVVLLDTAGRTHIELPLMIELEEIKAATNPHEILLVVDSLTGQDAVNLAQNFNDRIGITGSILTRMDGDGRGGAALSMRTVTGKPVKLIGTGEKIDALEEFIPSQIADRILGMGDIVALVDKAAEIVDEEKAEKIAKKLKKGKYDLEDHAVQLGNLENMGGFSSLLGMMPGMGKMKKQFDAADIDEGMFRRQRAIISSMTAHERRNPKLLNASRKRRIASGSGVEVQEVNSLLKMHRQMADFIKSSSRKKGGILGSLMGGQVPNFEPGMLEGVQDGSGLPGMYGQQGMGGIPGMDSLSGLGQKRKN